MAQANRINAISGLNIEPFHSFTNQEHCQNAFLWMCNGVCKNDSSKNEGIFSGRTNKAPGEHNDFWKHHKEHCGGDFIQYAKPILQYINKNPKKRTREEAEIAEHQEKNIKKRQLNPKNDNGETLKLRYYMEETRRKK